MLRTSRLTLLAPVLLLAGCGDDTELPEESDGRGASGEILPTSISDEMIATDRVRSQPPLLVDTPEGASAASSGESAGSAVADASGGEPVEEDAPAETAPAEEFEE